jgi:hypothetical protein
MKVIQHEILSCVLQQLLRSLPKLPPHRVVRKHVPCASQQHGRKSLEDLSMSSRGTRYGNVQRNSGHEGERYAMPVRYNWFFMLGIVC